MNYLDLIFKLAQTRKIDPDFDYTDEEKDYE